MHLLTATTWSRAHLWVFFALMLVGAGLVAAQDSQPPLPLTDETATFTHTPTDTPSPTSTIEPSETLTNTAFPTSTLTPTYTPTDIPSSTATPTPTNTPLPSETSTASATRVDVSTASLTPPSAMPTATFTPLPSHTPVLTQNTVIALSPSSTLSPTFTSTPASVLVSGSAPNQIMLGQSETLTLFGEGFTPTTIVRVIGFGDLPTTYVNSATLKAVLSGNIPEGRYRVEVSTPGSENVESPDGLSVVSTPLVAFVPDYELASAAFAQPPPEATIIPGQPVLSIRNFSTDPGAIAPGETVNLSFEVINRGSRPAQGVAVSVDAGGDFIPANGQASALLPDVGVNGVQIGALSVIASNTIEAGGASIPITFSYRDYTGQIYTSGATLSVTIQDARTFTMVVLSRYTVEPERVQPNETVTVRVLLTNVGNQAASELLVRVEGDVLIAGDQGNAFSFGDLAPNTSILYDLPLRAKSDLEPGLQSETITVTYLQDGEPEEFTGTITINIAPVARTVPLLLLESYQVGEETLRPGEQFIFTGQLHNVGEGDASNFLVTFGTVRGGGSDASGTSTTGGTSQTDTTSSNVFAPIGTGGSLYVGDFAANTTLTLTQTFIVNSGITSGVHPLPITLRYNDSTGNTVQENIEASVIVVVPPPLEIMLDERLPETLISGDSLPLSLQLLNTGADALSLTTTTIEVSGGEIIEGETHYVGLLDAGENTRIEGLVSVYEEGSATITVNVGYIDGLNREQVIVQTYTLEVILPPPMPTFDVSMNNAFIPAATSTPVQPDSLERLLLGFLGLGS